MQSKIWTLMSGSVFKDKMLQKYSVLYFRSFSFQAICKIELRKLRKELLLPDDFCAVTG